MTQRILHRYIYVPIDSRYLEMCWSA